MVSKPGFEKQYRNRYQNLVSVTDYYFPYVMMTHHEFQCQILGTNCNSRVRWRFEFQFMHYNHEYFSGYSVIYTMPNWITLGIMVITQFSHIMTFFWMKRQFSQSKSKQKHCLLQQHAAVAWPTTQQCCFCCYF